MATHLRSVGEYDLESVVQVRRAYGRPGTRPSSVFQHGRQYAQSRVVAGVVADALPVSQNLPKEIRSLSLPRVTTASRKMDADLDAPAMLTFPKSK